VEPSPTPRCSSCGATELTAPTRFDLSSPVTASVIFRPRTPNPGFLGIQVMHSELVDRARVCLACGHVMLGLSPASLAELRAKIGNLDPA
jgi:hypothetical protein